MKNLYNDDVTAMKQVEGGKERRSTIVPIVNAIDDVIDNINDDLTIAEVVRFEYSSNKPLLLDRSHHIGVMAAIWV